MNHKLIPLVLALAVTGAFAQANSAAGTAAEAAPAGDIRSAPANPFTGKPMSAEALQRELETTKLRSQLLEEQLRQVTLQEEVKNIPLRKQAEGATALTAAAREKLTQSTLERDLKEATKPAPKAETTPKPRADNKVIKAAPQPAELSKPVIPARTTINVLSVLATGGKRSAMLEINGEAVSVEDGQPTPYGRVRVTENGVHLDAQRMAVSDSTIGRVKRAETDAAGTPNGMRAAPNGAYVRPDSATAVPATPPVTALPPLVLPPAMKATVPTVPSAAGVQPGAQLTTR